MRRLKQRFGTFLRDEDGLILAEGLLMLPLVIWALVAMFIYWDVFRTINVTQKAAYGIADLLSRQKADITPTFADGLQKVVNFLTPGGHPVKMRITSLECVGTVIPNGMTGCTATDGSYKMLFSYSPQYNATVLIQSEIQDWKNGKIPVLNHGESVFVVETEVAFKAQLQTAIAGVEDAKYGQFIVTKPRHRRLCLQGTTTCV